MKKRIIITCVLAMLSIGVSNAQIFILEEDGNSSLRADVTPAEVPIPVQGLTIDQYAPLGGGSLLLIGFGAAYALSKRRKKED